jgi:hypothetical protein
MNLDWKHVLIGILGPVLSLGLAAGMGYLHSQGIDVPCPAAPTAVISAPAAPAAQ